MRTPLTVKERAIRRQKRLDKKRRIELPLFAAAGVLDEVAPLQNVNEIENDLLRWRAEWLEQSARAEETMRLRALNYRHVAAQYITPDQIAYIDRWIARVLPPGLEYAADHWHCLLRDLGIISY